MKAVIIVAHPDDETIWAGGLVLSHPDWDWTVLSLCRAGDTDRRPKFFAVCERLGAHGIIYDLDDNPEPSPIEPGRDIGQPILKALGETEWDLCITHGKNGEYGHTRHKQVHAEVVGLVESGRLNCKELWTFAYESDARKKTCRPADWSNKLIAVTKQNLAEKKRIVRQVYGFKRRSFENRVCVSPESFFVMCGFGQGANP